MARERSQEETLEPAPRTEPSTPPELEDLFRQHHRLVFQAAYRVTGDAMDAEDVLQTVFLRLARRAGGPGLDAHAASYLHRAAVNAGLDLVRARGRRPNVSLETTGELAGGEAADRATAGREVADWLRDALARLSPRAAEIFALRYLEGVSNRDIARLLGLSQVAVAVTLHRTRGRLRRQLGPIVGEAS
jgi:RNA polymerase sigma-70 factor (ECF subfamily)